MKEAFKQILTRLHIYHPLQSFYRRQLFERKKKSLQKLYAAYKGKGFTCNVCFAQYEKMAPDLPSQINKSALEKNKVIAGYGENILCPNCLSTARERLVLLMLQHDIPFAGKKILLLSPEKNIYTFLKDKAFVITADISPGFYRSIDAGIRKEDARAFQFENHSFDIVIANHVLEHIPQDAAAMKEMYRVLKAGGRAILQVPYSVEIPGTIETPGIHDAAMQSALYGQKDHVRIYQLQDYIKRLQLVGFQVEEWNYERLKPFYKNAIQQGESFLMIQKI
ncbi:MAG: methyltransferase domain-containing protein [Niastella sp.]|nr:methyltransferase domain-containing protein [Niastella sp.]